VTSSGLARRELPRKVGAVRRLVATLSLVCAWLCANGAIWDLSQLAAWARMFAGYSQTMTFSAALKETLDPSKPCEMCVGIAKAKQDSENRLPSSEAQAGAKFVLISHVVDEPVFTNDLGSWAETSVLAPCGRVEAVPLRPPRV
jgi:hypothetical protein